MEQTTDARPTEREHLWMLNTLMTVLATGDDTGGAYSVLRQRQTPAGNPPLHTHRDEDEAFYVIAGEVRFTVGGVTTVAGAGDFAFAPRGVPHGYEVTSDEADLLVLANPGGIERFFREVGAPAPEAVLPEPAAPDIDRVVATAARHGIEIHLP